MIVVLSRWCSRAISARICTRSLASRFDSGSSNRNTFGSRTIARPSATRCRCAAGKLARPAIEQRFDRQDLGRFAHALFDFGLRRAAHLQAERHVLVHRHVRVERVVLKHHGDVAVARRDVVHEPVADVDLAAGRLLPARRPSAASSILPQPLGPTSTMNSPSAISRFTSRTA